MIYRGLFFFILFFLSLSCTKKQSTTGNVIELKSNLESSESITGDKISANVVDGKIVILNFWASWCPACMEETPSLLKMTQRFSKDLILISVSEDESAKELQKFIKLFPLAKSTNVLLIHDQSRLWSQKYGIFKLPETFIFDRNSKLIRKFSGSIPFQNPEVERYFSDLITKKND